jgi:hypothetical protein
MQSDFIKPNCMMCFTEAAVTLALQFALIGADGSRHLLTSQEIMVFRTWTRYQIHFEAFALHFAPIIPNVSAHYQCCQCSWRHTHKPHHASLNINSTHLQFQVFTRCFLLANMLWPKETSTLLSTLFSQSYTLLKFPPHVRISLELKFIFTLAWHSGNRVLRTTDNICVLEVIRQTVLITTIWFVKACWSNHEQFTRLTWTGVLQYI